MNDQLDQQEIERLKGLKNKERMEIPRQKMPEQEPAERRSNFRDVPHGLPPMAAVKTSLSTSRRWNAPG